MVRGEPVGVVMVALRGAIFHQLQRFEVGGWDVVALKCKGSRLDASDNVVARYGC